MKFIKRNYALVLLVLFVGVLGALTPGQFRGLVFALHLGFTANMGRATGHFVFCAIMGGVFTIAELLVMALVKVRRRGPHVPQKL